MKRFWSAARATAGESGWRVELDGRPVRTPAQAMLAVPVEALASAIADEWNAVGGDIDPRSMPLTGLANAAIDRVSPDPPTFAAQLARYAEADLACYRAEGPATLTRQQAEHWDALLGWGRRRFDVDFRTTTGLLHVAQPEATVERLRHALSALDPFRLAGLAPLVTIGGSLLAGLAVLERAMTADDAWRAVTVDDRFHLDQWGSDAEAEAALDARRVDFMAAARFLELLGDGS